MTLSARKSSWLNHTGSGTPDASILIAASMTPDAVIPYLGGYLLERGFKNPKIDAAPYNQVREICRNHSKTIASDTDTLVILWRLEDLFGDHLQSSLAQYTAGQETQLDGDLKDFIGAVASLRAAHPGTIIINTPPYPSLPAFAPDAVGQPLRGHALYQSLLQQWLDGISAISGMITFDLAGLVLQHGLAQAYDARTWYLYRQPFSETFCDQIGTGLGRIIAANRQAPKKCLVLDADDTLWGGLAGEDGLEGIQLGHEFPGSAYRDFQKYLRHLKENGVLLAVASKNNPDDFFNVFDKHSAMVLTRQDIAAFEIGWQPKSDSIRRIAANLGISTDAIVFVDNSPHEIDEVHHHLPEVLTLKTPDELAELPSFLTKTHAFDALSVTDEDRQRTTTIIAGASREKLRSQLNPEEYKKSLGIRARVFKADDQHLARITQLINKTNQMNLTTIRRTQDEVRALMHNSEYLVLGLETRDKYGDDGLVGVAIIKKPSDAAVLDTFLMSCRVLGRDIETAFLAVIAAHARGLRCQTLKARYIETAKNQPAKDMLSQHGFSPAANGQDWFISLTHAPNMPPHIDCTLPPEN